MTRLAMVVVASALIVVAVTALDAVGADSRTAKPKTTIAQCLRDHDVAVPQQAPLAVARACKQAAGGSAAGDTADATKLVACLRAHGAQSPSAPEALKPWILQHQSDPALKACGVGVSPGCGDKGGQGAPPTKGGKT